MSSQRKTFIGVILLYTLIIVLVGVLIAQVVTYLTTDPIKVETINYVLANKDTPEFETYKTGEYIYYTSTGYWDASVEYGFRYRISDAPRGEPNYKNGYRQNYGSCNWYYEEEICENWWYYENHEG